ncbi:MAG: galactonate dehydratase [Chloroflexi bacterium]|nr:galactonate dehydratase [Chloroflexota bacterium]
MKITDIQTFVVHIGWRNYLFVKVNTDEGISGIGEAYPVGPDKATVEAIDYFEEWLRDKDPRDIEGLWQLMYNGSRFPGGSILNAAISGIEHALFDIAGKAYGIPLYQLLGGKCRNKIRVYQAPHGDTPEELAEDALRLIDRYGFTALKIGPHPPGQESMPWNAVVRGAAARMEAVRKAVGDDIDIACDPHAKIFEPSRAIDMANALKPYRPLFVEELTRPETVDALIKVRAHTEVPLATGEMLYTKFEFKDLLVTGAADIVQPDICLCGGIQETKKIASMAEAFYVDLAPHNPLGPVATAVNVHLAATCPNFIILEYTADDVPGRKEFLKEPVKLKDGYLEIPDKPGLGVELNEEAFARYPSVYWRRPIPIRPDGSVAFQ